MEEQNNTGPTPELNSISAPHSSTLSVLKDLLCWRDVRRSVLVFCGSLWVLLVLAWFSVITVVSYVLLALLCFTITFRVYKSVLQALSKTPNGHPFRFLLEKDISISPEVAHRHTDLILQNLNWVLLQTRRLLLVEDIIDSLKLAGLMWCLTYVGALFNAVTLLILADVVFFCTPLVYKKYKTQINRCVEQVRKNLEEKLEKYGQSFSITPRTHRLVQEKFPGAVKRMD